MTAEDIKPYDGDGRNKSEQVREMFDNIAPAYDFMNSAMSLGLHRRWLRRTVEAVASENPSAILDVATGTADVAIRVAKRLKGAKIKGIDLSEGMIEIGRKKIEREGLSARIELLQADCLSLPFDDNSFDCVTVAYGVRNFEGLEAGYREMLRVLRPGGSIYVIELTTPGRGIIKPFYNFYTRHIIPTAGRLVSKDVRAYSYLPESIAAVAQRGEMTALMERAGFESASFRSFNPGVCCLYTARKRGEKPENT